jgi:hypothetical protein
MMNISQSSLENAVRNKMTSGYLAMDSKNTILWGALTALFISSNVITYTVAFSGGWEGANLAQATTISALSFSQLENKIISDYESRNDATSSKSSRVRGDNTSANTSLQSSKRSPRYSYIDSMGNEVMITPF